MYAYIWKRNRRQIKQIKKYVSKNVSQKNKYKKPKINYKNIQK